MARESISLRQRFRILMRDHFTCMYCGKRPPMVVLNVDHYIPVSEGGSGDDRNLITACRDCNSGKAASIPPAAGRIKNPDAHYWAAERCDCERPSCGGILTGRDHLENICKCKFCHGCYICGETDCPMAEDGRGECWSVAHYLDDGNEKWLSGVESEYVKSCRVVRQHRIDTGSRPVDWN
jgi:hypothetical protein